MLVHKLIMEWSLHGGWMLFSSVFGLEEGVRYLGSRADTTHFGAVWSGAESSVLTA